MVEHVVVTQKPVLREYLFEIIDATGKIVQSGKCLAADKHEGAAYAALAKSIKRPQTTWHVRVALPGATKSGLYEVERLDKYRITLTRVTLNVKR